MSLELEKVRQSHALIYNSCSFTPFIFESSKNTQKNGLKMPLPNKTGEPEFKLKVDPPEKLVFKYKMNADVEIPMVITNPTKDRVVYKVKCTDNQIFRVRPPLGFINKGEQATVKITLKPRDDMDPTKHYLAIYHVSCKDPKEMDPRAVWTPEAKPQGVLRMQVQMESEDKVDVKKEEKKDDKKDEAKKEDNDEAEKKEDK